MEIFDVIANTKEGKNFELICRSLFETFVKKCYQYPPKYHIKFFVRVMKNGSIDLDPGFYDEAAGKHSITSAHRGIFGYKAKIWQENGKFWHRGPAHLLTSSFDTIEECLNSIYANTIAFMVLNKSRSKETQKLINTIIEMPEKEKDRLNVLLSDYFKANEWRSADITRILDTRKEIEKMIHGL
jgi:hypothetical protein